MMMMMTRRASVWWVPAAHIQTPFSMRLLLIIGKKRMSVFSCNSVSVGSVVSMKPSRLLSDSLSDEAILSLSCRLTLSCRMKEALASMQLPDSSSEPVEESSLSVRSAGMSHNGLFIAWASCAPSAESIHTGNSAIPLTKTRLLGWFGSSFEAGVANSLAAEEACFFEADFTDGAPNI